MRMWMVVPIGPFLGEIVYLRVIRIPPCATWTPFTTA